MLAVILGTKWTSCCWWVDPWQPGTVISWAHAGKWRAEYVIPTIYTNTVKVLSHCKQLLSHASIVCTVNTTADKRQRLYDASTFFSFCNRSLCVTMATLAMTKMEKVQQLMLLRSARSMKRINKQSWSSNPRAMNIWLTVSFGCSTLSMSLILLSRWTLATCGVGFFGSVVVSYSIVPCCYISNTGNLDVASQQQLRHPLTYTLKPEPSHQC